MQPERIPADDSFRRAGYGRGAFAYYFGSARGRRLDCLGVDGFILTEKTRHSALARCCLKDPYA